MDAWGKYQYLCKGLPFQIINTACLSCADVLIICAVQQFYLILSGRIVILLVPTAAPQMLSGFPLTSTLLRLTWSPPPAEDVNGVITFYLVEVTEVISNTLWTFHAVQTSINVGPLHPYYNYQCRVTAFTIGTGPFTSFFYVTTGETCKCYNLLV